MDGCQSFFFKNFSRQLELSSGSRLSSLWPNERSITVPTCCSQPSKGTVLTLLRNIRRERYFQKGKDGRRQKDGDDSFRPTVPKPEPDEELLAELCRLPPLPEDQGGQTRRDDLNFCWDDYDGIVSDEFARGDMASCRVRSTSLASSS